jgi:hypothetical protein
MAPEKCCQALEITRLSPVADVDEDSEKEFPI